MPNKGSKVFSAKGVNKPFNTTLTTLACLVAGLVSAPAQADDLNGCDHFSVVRSQDSNGCSVSVGLNQKIDGSVTGGNTWYGSANQNRVNIAHGAYIQGAVQGGGCRWEAENRQS